MTVSEFCKQYGISHQAVYKKIERERYGKLDGHVYKFPGEPTEIDDFAAEYLRPKKEKMKENSGDTNALRDELSAFNDMYRECKTTVKSLSAEFEKYKAGSTKQHIRLVTDMRKYLSDIEEKISAFSIQISCLNEYVFRNIVTDETEEE